MRAPKIAKEGLSYLVIGLMQMGVDWAAFICATALGLPVVPANVLARVCGAMLGFWMNGKYTFSSSEHATGVRQAKRFLLLWLLTTMVSTALMKLIDMHLGLGVTWLAKPLVDLSLSAIGFALSRHWVYRR